MNVKDKGEREAWIAENPDARHLRSGFRVAFDYIDALEAERDAMRENGGIRMTPGVLITTVAAQAARDMAVAEAVREACDNRVLGRSLGYSMNHTESFLAAADQVGKDCSDAIRALDLAAVIAKVK